MGKRTGPTTLELKKLIAATVTLLFKSPCERIFPGTTINSPSLEYLSILYKLTSLLCLVGLSRYLATAFQTFTFSLVDKLLRSAINFFNSNVVGPVLFPIVLVFYFNL